eukprot:scaffold133178_cov67-Attheya_sp.AAC.1
MICIPSKHEQTGQAALAVWRREEIAESPLNDSMALQHGGGRQRKKENIILVTIIDDVGAPDVSAFGVYACLTLEFVELIYEMVRLEGSVRGIIQKGLHGVGQEEG